MNLLPLKLIGIGLSIIGLAASVTTGACPKSTSLKMFLSSFFYGVFLRGNASRWLDNNLSSIKI